MKIKTLLYSLLLLMVALNGVTSCKSDDDSSSSSDKCYISAFTLGNMKRTMYGGSTGDSAYTVTFSPSLFPMNINQRENTIENQDSLPYGAKVSAALATITYEGSLYYQYNYENGTDTWHSYSSTDSMDFSNPIKMLVNATNGLSSRTYTVKLNVHQQNGSKFSWCEMASDDELADLSVRRAVAWKGGVLMMGKKSDGTIVCAHRKSGDQSWTFTKTDAPAVTDVTTLQVNPYGDKLFVSTTEGKVLKSEDDSTWTNVTVAVSGLRLVGVSRTSKYAIADGKLLCSVLDDADWTEEDALDESGSLLPDGNISMSYCEQTNGYCRMVLTGTLSTSTDKKAVVWSKAWQATHSESPSTWMYYPHTTENPYHCPDMNPLFVMPYASGLIAMGGTCTNDTTSALSRMLYSEDYGITWKKNDEFYTTSSMKGITDATAIAVDENNFVWVMAGKRTWRGRLNRLGFAK